MKEGERRQLIVGKIQCRSTSGSSSGGFLTRLLLLLAPFGERQLGLAGGLIAARAIDDRRLGLRSSCGHGLRTLFVRVCR